MALRHKRRQALATVLAALVALAASAPAAAQAAADQPITTKIPKPEPTDGPEAWWTGSMLSNSGATLPKGHVLIEPYLFDRLADDTSSYGSFTYLLYGLTDYLSVGATPTFGYATQRGRRVSSGVGVGDLTLRAQLRLIAASPSSWKPAVALSVGHSLPIGKYDRLGPLPGNGQGSGLAATTVSLYAQSSFLAPSRRPMRVRLNASVTLPASTSVSDISVYGTTQGSSTRVRQGTTVTLGTSVEYSLTRSWALALDVLHVRNGDVRLMPRGISSGATPAGSRGQTLVAIAPGIEYSWNSNYGVLLAARYVPGSATRPASWTPAIALNAYL